MFGTNAKAVGKDVIDGLADQKCTIHPEALVLAAAVQAPGRPATLRRVRAAVLGKG